MKHMSEAGVPSLRQARCRVAKPQDQAEKVIPGALLRSRASVTCALNTLILKDEAPYNNGASYADVKILRPRDRGALWLSVIALLFITSMTCISVIGRYFFSAPVPDDLVMSRCHGHRGLPAAGGMQAAREHVFVTIFSDWLPNRPKVAMEYSVSI